MRKAPSRLGLGLLGFLLCVAPCLGALKITPLFSAGASTPAKTDPINVRNVVPGAAAVQLWCVGTPPGTSCTATGVFVIEIRSYEGAPWKQIRSYESFLVECDADGCEGGEYETLPVTGDARVRLKEVNSGTVTGALVIND